LDHLTKNAIYPKFKMAAAANLDFIKVQFLCHGWADSHQICYVGAEWQHVIESVTKIIIFWRNEMAAGAILDFGKIAIK